MDSLEELVDAVVTTIVELRKDAVGCLGIRPKDINKNRHPIYSTAVMYILDLLVQEGLTRRQRRAKGVKYLICRDSALYSMDTESLKSTIMEIVERHEKKRNLN